MLDYDNDNDNDNDHAQSLWLCCLTPALGQSGAR
jgi:hypothetical protein